MTHEQVAELVERIRDELKVTTGSVVDLALRRFVVYAELDPSGDDNGSDYRMRNAKPVPVIEIADALRSMRNSNNLNADSSYSRGISSAIAELQDRLRIHPNLLLNPDEGGPRTSRKTNEEIATEPIVEGQDVSGEQEPIQDNVFTAVMQLWKAIHPDKIRPDPGLPVKAEYGAMAFTLVEEEFQELKDAYEAGDVVEIADAIADLIVVAVGLGVAYGIPTQDVFNEVHKTNMAKFPGGKIIRREDGKVLKPEGWQPPDVKGILERAGMWQAPEIAVKRGGLPAGEVRDLMGRVGPGVAELEKKPRNTRGE